MTGTGGRHSTWRPILLRESLLSTSGLLVLFLALQFLIPARLVISGMGAAGRPSVAIGVLLAFLWCLTAVRGLLPRGGQPVRWAVGAFLLAQVVGNIVGFDRLATAGQASAADRWLIVTVGALGVILAVADGVRARAHLDLVLRMLVLFAAVMSIVGVLQFFRVVDLTRMIRIPGLRVNQELIGIGSRGDADFARVAGTASHYIEYGVVLATVLPLALHYVVFSPPGLVRWWRSALLAIVALGIPLSISRAATLTLFLVMAMTAVVWTWRLRYNVLVLGLVGLSVFHVLNRGVLGTIRALFTQAENDPSVTARIDRASTVMELWRERPVLGWGSGMVTPSEFLLLDNQIFMFLIAGGAVGVFTFLLLFFIPYLLGRSVRLRAVEEEDRHLGHVLAVTMPAAVVVSGTFDSFSFATWLAVMSVLIGACGALWRIAGGSAMGPVRRSAPSDRTVASPWLAHGRVGRWLADRSLSRVPVSSRPAPTEVPDPASPAAGPPR